MLGPNLRMKKNQSSPPPPLGNYDAYFALPGVNISVFGINR